VSQNATPAATHALRALVAGAVLVGSSWLLSGPAHAGLGEPLDPDGTTTEAEEAPAESSTTTTTDADEPGTTVADRPTTTVATSGDADEPASTTEDDDDGTSIAALGAVGVVAFILGLLVAAIPLGVALSRRTSAPARPGPAPIAPTPAPTPTPAPAAAAAGPAIGPAPSRDADQLRQQRVVLVEALIALRDKLPSEALAGEAAQALAGAGITELRPEGVPFDPAQHRAVHQVPTDDPARHNTVAGVERPGYRDGSGAIIRQPEVVVAVHGSPS
jgi:hypothetical protein